MEDFELKEGRYVKIGGSHASAVFKDKFFYVKAVEPKQYKTGMTSTAEFTAVTTGSTSGYRNIDVLEPDDRPMHLFYFRWGVKDGCSYQLKIPTGSDRLGVDKDMDSARITNVESPWCNPSKLFGFYLVTDMYPAFNANNDTPETVTPAVFFIGEAYDIEQVNDAKIIQKLQNYDQGIAPYIPHVKITLGGVDA